MPHFFAAALRRIARSVHVTCLVARKVQKEALLVVSGISRGMKAVYFGGKTILPKCAVFLFLCALFILPSLPTHASITPLINYQGKLLTSSSVPVASGTYQIEFTLYDAASSGNVLWTASGTTGSPDPINVPVSSQGLFSILLGDTDNGQNTLEGVNWNTSSLYLGITVGSDSEMTPRKRLSSTPQAFNAEAWNGYKTATSINEGQGGEVLKLSQTSNDAASVLRTVLQLTTSGTSALLDSFLRLTDNTLGDVFTINRQGHTTTTGNLASLGNTFLGDSDADTLIISSRIASDLIPTLSDTFSLGSDSLRWNAFLGTASTTYLSANTLNVTSTLTYLNAEGTNTTTTHLSVTTLAELPENTTINGQSPCLSDGTGCDTPTLQEVTNAGSFTTTSLTLFGGLTTSDLTATGTTSLQDFTFSHGTGTSLTLNGLFTVSSALSSLQALTFTNATGSALNLTGAFTFANATGTSLFLNTLLTASDILSTNSITINGTNVCLEDGTNCVVAPTATNFWTYDATDDFLRPNTSTTDFVLGAGSIATSPFYFQASATSSRLYLGAFNSTGTNVVLGATTSTFGGTSIEEQQVVYSGTTSTIFTVPEGVTSVTVKVWSAGGGGGGGGNNAGGTGGTGGGAGFVEATLSVTELEDLEIRVGAGGGGGAAYPGSGTPNSGGAGGGGGYSGIFRGSVNQIGALAVAGAGGGGGGADNGAVSGGAGGAGGGFSGATGTTVGTGIGGGAGTQVQGGIGGGTGGASAGAALAGGEGGDGPGTLGIAAGAGGSPGGGGGGQGSNQAGGGGGGGAGYFGGGGATSTSGGGNTGGGGGGGSAFATSTATSVTVTAGSGTTPAGTGDEDYGGGAGVGGAGGAGAAGGGTAGTTGADGRIVITYTQEVEITHPFQLDGNDLFVAGNIGSASSVYTNGAFIAGSGTTLFGDGFITRTGGNLTVSSSQHVLFLPSSNVGIGTSTPSEKLTVVGNIQNLFGTNTSTSNGGMVAVTAFQGDGGPRRIAVQGRYAYVADQDEATLGIFDLSDPANPALISLVGTGSGAADVAVSGRYAYVANSSAGTVSIVDVSNPTSPVEMDEVATGGNVRGIAVQGSYLYAANATPGTLSIVDVSDPSNAVELTEFATGAGAFSVQVQGRYAYVANTGAGSLSVVDISNPQSPIETDEILTGASSETVAVQGRYAYVSSQGTNMFVIVDVSDPSNLSIVKSVSVFDPIYVAVSGRYAYVANFTSGFGTDKGSFAVIDVTSSTEAFQVAEIAVQQEPTGLAISGRYAYVANYSSGTVSVVKLPGIETTAIEAHSAEVGGLGVRGSAVINNGLTVGGGLNVGQGGIYSAGPLAVSAINTTSTFLAAVSSTVGTFTTQVTVGGQLVCLADGTNCQAGGGGDAFFTYNAADDFIRPNTSTTDFILGANSIATAPFYFQTQTTSSRLYLGAFNATGTNVVLGATTSTITNTLFQLDGNDLFVAGNIGSASSVYTNGAFIAGTTLYGDGFINAPSGNLVVSSSAHVAFMPSSNVGIGTSTPSEKLTVVGNIFQEGQAFAQEIGSLALDAGAQSLAVQDRFAYVGTASTGDDFHVIDLSVPGTPVRTSAVNLGAITVSDMEVRTPYAYLATGVGARIINISNPSAAATGTLLSLSGITGLDVQGRYAYLGVNAASGPHLRAVDLADPTALVNVGSGLSGSLVVNDVAAVGQYAYLATSLASSQFYVMNIADPQFPATGTAITLPATGNAVKVQGRYAYVGTSGTGNDFHVIDISNPASPSVVGAIDLGSGNVNEISVQGRYAYLATANSGAQFRIVDISNPAAPVPSTAVSLSDTANAVWVQGRYAYVATNGTGDDFHVIALKGLETTALEAHSIEVGSLGVRGNAVITNNVDVAGGLSVGSGANFNDEVSIYGSTTSTLGALYVSQECPGSLVAERIASFAVRGDNKISIRCSGQVFADNGISGTGGDYAEYFISSDSLLEAGDVVAFDPQHATTVTKGMAALRNHTLGVVSTKPVVTGMGHLEHHPSSTRVGLLGQLDTKVSTRAEEIEAATGKLPAANADLMIRVGDFLMAGENGIVVKAHGPGIVLGRALEDFPAHATGTVRAFIAPSYWAGGSFVADENGATLLISDLTVAAAEDAPLPSPLFSLQGRVLGAATSTSYTHTYSFQTNVMSATSSFFTLFGEVLGAGDASSSSTRKSLLQLSHEGDLFLSRKLYPGERMVNTDGAFSWNAQAHASIFFHDTLQSLHTNTGFSSDQDGFATQFKTKDTLEPGDLVIFDPENPGYVKKSETYGTGAIAGVVAEYAGFVSSVASLTNTKDTFVTVVVTGKATLNVSTQNGEILSGDPLTSSDIPGVAMKATEPSAFAGIALEGWSGGTDGPLGASVTSVTVSVQGGWFAGSLNAAEAETFGSAAFMESSFTGLAQILAGEASVHVAFPSAMPQSIVFATPSAAPGTWWIANQSDVGFDIILAAPLAYDITFSWTAEPTPDGAVMWHSDGTYSTGTVMQPSSSSSTSATGTTP